MDKTIAIIGAGVSGLTAGIYAQQQGFKTVIYEKHSLAGGLCSYWCRNGYMLDNCIHWLTGSCTKSALNDIWRNTHILREDTEVLQSDFFLQAEHNGETLCLWRDMEKLRHDMLAVSASDEKSINEFIRLLGIYKDTVVVADKPLESYSLLDWAKLMLKMRHIGKVHRKYSKMSLEEYASQFTHPLLRKLITAYFPHHYNVASMLFVYAIYCNTDAGLPQGGSRGVVKRMTERYLSLGGEIRYGKEVVAIKEKADNVTQICFANGDIVSADFYIAACDLHYTMSHLLQEKHIDNYMREHYLTRPELYPTYSAVSIYFGADTAETILPGTVLLDTDGLEIDGRRASCCIVKDFNYEPTFAPAGKSVLQVLITQYEQDYNYWQLLRENSVKLYNEEKQRVAEYVEQCLIARYPKYQDKLNLLDVATPVTHSRYTNTYKGAYMSFCLTPYNTKLTHNGRVQGLQNMYLAGQWLQSPGGLPNAVITGKFAIQRICRDWHLPFK